MVSGRHADELDVLKNNPDKWLTVKEIFKLSNYDCGIVSLQIRLRKARRWNTLLHKSCRIPGCNLPVFMYKHKKEEMKNV